MTASAECASAIRKELKGLYPGVKFSVTSETYSMGNSVNISWAGGPESQEVRELTRKYQEGSFNGMEDIYEYTNRNSDLPQAKYVFADRRES